MHASNYVRSAREQNLMRSKDFESSQQASWAEKGYELVSIAFGSSGSIDMNAAK